MNGLMIALGFGLASWVGLAFNSLVSPGDAQWRGPIGVGILFCLIILVLLIFIPESPRWKIMNGQLDEAWVIIRAIHQNPHTNNQSHHDFARHEFDQICKQIELDKTLDSSWLQMFRKPSYRRRSLLAMTYAFLGESTAMLVITNYGSILYKQLGYNSHDQIVLEAAYQVVPFVGNLIGSLIVDKIGRRPLMLAGLIGCCTFVCIETAMVASFVDGGPKNPAGLRMGVAALFCFIFCYAVGVDVAGIVFYGEIFPNHIRAKGLTLAVSCRTLADLIYLESATSAFANIGWRFFLVFISVMVVGIIVMYFVLPETRGLPLEEVAALFGDEAEVRSHMSQLNAGVNDEACLTLKVNGDWVDSQKPFVCLHLEYAGA
ncbi:hypothetical protein EIK77_009452 [Talaromyces pinophilus]|nr:hypothetical protein EIK77_009452 [Talaromyces pinophilus]PCG99643.1 Major facilitator superfamily domain, general substrate transporter [Penicillium occitanis (nom. inval.)]PCH00371.1 hypothetical protein PENOC_053390 [Penicillium occitanis (nom. inval.)]